MIDPEVFISAARATQAMTRLKNAKGFTVRIAFILDDDTTVGGDEGYAAEAHFLGKALRRNQDISLAWAARLAKEHAAKTAEQEIQAAIAIRDSLAKKDPS